MLYICGVGQPWLRRHYNRPRLRQGFEQADCAQVQERNADARMRAVAAKMADLPVHACKCAAMMREVPIAAAPEAWEASDLIAAGMPTQ